MNNLFKSIIEDEAFEIQCRAAEFHKKAFADLNEGNVISAIKSQRGAANAAMRARIILAGLLIWANGASA